ncbi:lysophospholipid acyltransferase family protein [Alteromonas gracilis]
MKPTPRPDQLRTPSSVMLGRRAPTARAVLERRYRISRSGMEHFPTSGPVVVAANHTGWWDGPLMAILAPRPVHALTKQEMFAGPLGTFLTRAGQIPLDRIGPDRRALRMAQRVLDDGGCVGVFPEGARGDGEMRTARGGAAYLAMVCGAPVLPMVLLGTRLPGAPSGSRPPRGSRIHLAYGPPIDIARTPWPRRRADVARTTETIRTTVADLLQRSVAETGIHLPGPLPEGAPS